MPPKTQLLPPTTSAACQYTSARTIGAADSPFCSILRKWLPFLLLFGATVNASAQCKSTLGYLEAQIPSVADADLTSLRQKILATNIKDVVAQIHQQNLSFHDGAKSLMANADTFDDALAKDIQIIKQLGGSQPESESILRDLKARDYKRLFPAGSSALAEAIKHYVLADWGQLSMRESAVQLLCLARNARQTTSNTRSSDPKSSTHTSESATSSQARAHVSIAKAAIDNHDLATAKEELIKASRLTPDDAEIFYQLAAVEDKQNDLAAADASLKTAEKLRFSDSLKSSLEELRASIDYKLQKEAEAMRKADEVRALKKRLRWLAGQYEYTLSKPTLIDKSCGIFHVIQERVVLAISEASDSLEGTYTWGRWDNDVVNRPGPGCGSAGKTYERLYYWRIASIVPSSDQCADVHLVLDREEGNLAAIRLGATDKRTACRVDNDSIKVDDQIYKRLP